MNTDKEFPWTPRVIPSAARNLLFGLSLLLLLPVTAAAGEAYKVPGTKDGFVTTPDGVKIHYLEAGYRSQTLGVARSHGFDEKGRYVSHTKSVVVALQPVILFVPGWTMPAWIWEKQIAHFSKTHRVVAMDPRSQGESQQTTEGHYPAARARDKI